MFTTTQDPPAFPEIILVRGVEIRLNADGSFTGDRRAFLDALAHLKKSEVSFFGPTLWLIAAELQRAKEAQP